MQIPFNIHKTTFYVKLLLLLVICGLFLATGFSTDAFATAQVKVKASTGPTTVTVIDDGVGDLDPTTEGQIIMSTPLGGFTTNINIAITKPLIGGMIAPQMDITHNSVKSSGGVATLTIEFTDTDFTGELPASFTSTIGGTSPAGIVVMETYMDRNNVPFAKTELLTNSTALLGVGVGGAFTDEKIKEVTLDGDYSLTMVLKITEPAASSSNRKLTSFDALLNGDILVGGEEQSINNSALFIAGMQSSAIWLVPAVVTASTIGYLTIRKFF